MWSIKQSLFLTFTIIRAGEAAGTRDESEEYRENSIIFLYQLQRLCQCQEVGGLCG